MQKGFSAFSWALALFCVPGALWPLALLISPSFSENPALTPSQVDWFSILFWVYPLILLVIAGMLYKLHRTHAKLARGLLFIAFAVFYGILIYIVKSL